MATKVRRDPRVLSKQDRCFLCGRERPEAAVKEGDPFCSTPCARKYHGTELEPTETAS